MSVVETKTIRVVSPTGMINYCYAVVDHLNRSCVLIDPAWQLEVVQGAIQSYDVKGVFVTHHHTDHVDLCEKLSLLYECPVWMSLSEVETYNFKCSNLNVFHDKWVVRIDGITVQALVTPGHTKGSTCYLIHNNLFTGDTLFAEGCGICWGVGGSPIDMYQSLEMLKKDLDPSCCIYPGHSYGVEVGRTFGELLRINLYLNFSDQDSFVKFRMRKNQKKLLAFK